MYIFKYVQEHSCTRKSSSGSGRSFKFSRRQQQQQQQQNNTNHRRKCSMLSSLLLSCCTQCYCEALRAQTRWGALEVLFIIIIIIINEVTKMLLMMVIKTMTTIDSWYAENSSRSRTLCFHLKSIQFSPLTDWVVGET